MINQFTGYKGWVTQGGMGMIDVDSSSAQSASNGKLSVPTTHDLKQQGTGMYRQPPRNFILTGI
jgi:hypothetical protein